MVIRVKEKKMVIINKDGDDNEKVKNEGGKDSV